MAIIVFTYETSINREGPKFGRKFCYETDLAALHTPYDRLCTENTAIYRLKYLTKRNITQVINVVLSESVYNVSNTRTDRLVLWLDATVDSVLRRDILGDVCLSGNVRGQLSGYSYLSRRAPRSLLPDVHVSPFSQPPVITRDAAVRARTIVPLCRRSQMTFMSK